MRHKLVIIFLEKTLIFQLFLFSLILHFLHIASKFLLANILSRRSRIARRRIAPLRGYFSCSTLDSGRSTSLLSPQKGSKFTIKRSRDEIPASGHIRSLPRRQQPIYLLPYKRLDQALFHLGAPKRDHQPKPDTRTIVFFSAANSSKSNVKPDLLKRI